MIQKTFDIEMAPRTVRDLLPTLGLSPQMPVVKSHKHSDEEALRWATQEWNTDMKIWNYNGTPTIIMAGSTKIQIPKNVPLIGGWSLGSAGTGVYNPVFLD